MFQEGLWGWFLLLCLLIICFPVGVWAEHRAPGLKFNHTWVQNPQAGDLEQVVPCPEPQCPCL